MQMAENKGNQKWSQQLVAYKGKKSKKQFNHTSIFLETAPFHHGWFWDFPLHKHLCVYNALFQGSNLHKYPTVTGNTSSVMDVFMENWLNKPFLFPFPAAQKD